MRGHITKRSPAVMGTVGIAPGMITASGYWYHVQP